MGPIYDVTSHISQTSARPAAIRPHIAIRGETTRVLVEQTGAVDIRNLGRAVGRLRVVAMWRIDENLATVPGLK